MKAIAFDAYGTLWRLEQLQYSMLRSLMGRHRDFWRVTEDALVYAVAGAGSIGLETFWIQRRAAEPPEELGFAADHTVATITDLVPLLRG